jgi:hypothetical protein
MSAKGRTTQEERSGDFKYIHYSSKPLVILFAQPPSCIFQTNTVHFGSRESSFDLTKIRRVRFLRRLTSIGASAEPQ